MATSTNASRTLLIALSFGTIYVVWSSTYLAIRYALDSMPPFFMASVRFLAAGALMYVVIILRGGAAPSWAQWRSAALCGMLMLLGGNGMVSWAEQTVPSGLAALFIATMPLWMVLLDWGFFRGARPTGRLVAGLLLGLTGVGMLIGTGGLRGNLANPLGAAALLTSCVCWSLGSLFSRGADQPKSPFMTVAMQMLCGGVALFAAGALTGEWSRVDVSGVTLRSALSLVYLIFFGSIAALSAYVWLLRVCTAARVATYAYVNPVLAVLLGHFLAGEAVTSRIVFATALIFGAVVLVTTARQSGPRGARPPVVPVGNEDGQRAAGDRTVALCDAKGGAAPCCDAR